MMANKRERQQTIRRLIDSQAVASQEELRRLLGERGLSVTQATLSRDLREMGVVRVPSDGGARYRLPEGLGDEAKPSVEVLLPQFFTGIDGVGELIVLHTMTSGAQPIAEAIDAQSWVEVLGTLAGENTVLIICRSPGARTELMARLEALAGG